MPDQPTPEIRPVPLDAIDPDLLPRDRTVLDAAALTELQSSILRTGLRMPIEVVPHPYRPEGFALLSGYRRLHAFRAIVGMGFAQYATIPAIVRANDTTANHLAAVIEENEIRAELSPWERGHIAWTATRMELFATVEEAVEKLYPSANRQKQHRLRALAHVAEELDGHLTDPELLSLRQCLRLDAALSRGYGDLIRHALAESTPKSAEGQWRVLLAILVEAETTVEAEPLARSTQASRPRRTLNPRHGLKVWREMTRDGWCLHFTGREARGMLIDTVLDELERMFSPA